MNLEIQLKNRSETISPRSDVKDLINSGKSIYVFGRNSETLCLVRKLKIAAIIDDRFGKKEWENLPIVRFYDIEDDSIIINLSSSVSPLDVRRLINVKGKSQHVLELSDLIYGADPIINPPDFVLAHRDELDRNIEWWEDFYDRLVDLQSRQTLLDTLSYKTTGVLDFMNDYEVRLQDQYFEPFMNYSEEIFVDAGGYDGDTSEIFIKHCPDYKQIYFFEPSKLNMKQARERLSKLENIEFIDSGLSDETGILYFNPEQGSASSFNEVGDFGESVPVVTLDQWLQGRPVTFIKMDLEGWELRALHGAMDSIKRYRPKLAIAVYHTAADTRLIVEFIKKLNPDYKYYLRHYTQGWSETILYFR